MIEVPKIVFRIDREHEARAIAAIRERRAREAEADEDFRVLPWFRERGEGGRFVARKVA